MTPKRNLSIQIYNRQRRYPICRRNLQIYTSWVMEQVRRMKPDNAWSEVVLVLTRDRGMITYQKACFGRDNTTDVISQRYLPMPPESDSLVGEVIVNLDAAEARNASEGRSRELARYILHGCLHLANMEDATVQERAAMRRRETAWLRRAESGPLMYPLMESARS